MKLSDGKLFHPLTNRYGILYVMTDNNKNLELYTNDSKGSCIIKWCSFLCGCEEFGY